MLALILLLIPLIGSILLFFLRGSNPGVSKNVALAATLAEFVVAAYTFANFDSQTLIEVKYAWMKDLRINFHLGIDGISLLMVALTAFLIPLIVLSTFKYNYKNPVSFYALI